MTITVSSEAVWGALGALGGVGLTTFGFLVLGAYGHDAWGVRVSPVVAHGLQSAFRTMAYSTAGVVVANAGNWAASLLVHYGVPTEAATAAGLVLGGALSGGHQGLQLRAEIRAQEQGGTTT